MLKFALYALATWRLTQMLVAESGPGEIFVKLREASGIEHTASGEIQSWGNDWTPLHCTKCTSVYVAALMLFAPGWLYKLLAASTISVLIDKKVS